MCVGVVRGESAVGVPLRRLFPYEWMDVNYFISTVATEIGFRFLHFGYSVRTAARQALTKLVLAVRAL
jgi:hypothetical protein